MKVAFEQREYEAALWVTLDENVSSTSYAEWLRAFFYLLARSGKVVTLKAICCFPLERMAQCSRLRAKILCCRSKSNVIHITEGFHSGVTELSETSDDEATAAMLLGNDTGVCVPADRYAAEKDVCRAAG